LSALAHPVELPLEELHVGAGNPFERGNLVEFRLLYEGDLPSCTNANRHPKEKHAIRRALHPQLRRLWSLRSNLRHLAERYLIQAIGNDAPLGTLKNVPELDVDLSPEDRFNLAITHIGQQFNRAGYNIVPLVTDELVLQCSLDILLLRPRGERFIFRQGDIDGQLKTLFDALRIPSNGGETREAIPTQDEDPLFCLLEDDKLISEVRVTTDELLLLPNQSESDLRATHAHAVIHVKLNHRDHRTFDNYFG
jgi:hypothetical protein